MTEKKHELEFRFGAFGKYIPILIAVAFIVLAATHESNVNGYVVAFFMALVLSIPFVKSEKAYGAAVIQGIARPMFGVIGLAIILASIAGKLISASGLVQTAAAYVVKAGFSGGLFAAAAMVITCVISFSTGTSVGTNLIVIPILYPIGVMAGVNPAFMVGAIVSGSAFGDNLAPVSDTTIASAGSQGADMAGVVRSRAKYSLPVAVVACILFAVFGGGGERPPVLEVAETAVNNLSLVMLAVPAVIIVLCLIGKHLVTALSWGVVAGLVVGLVSGLYAPGQILGFPGGFKVEGLFIDSIIGCMNTVAMLIGVFALLGVLQASGVVEAIGKALMKLGRGVRSTEATIVGSIAILGMITGVIAVGIVAIGDIIRQLGERVGIDKYRRANLMDCAGIGFCFLAPWTVHTVLPAQLTSSLGEAFAVNPLGVATHNFYALVMVAFLIMSILTGYGRKTKITKRMAQAEADAEGGNL